MTRYVIVCLIVILSYVEVLACEQPRDEDFPNKGVLTFLHADKVNHLQDGNNKILLLTGSGGVGLRKHEGIERTGSDEAFYLVKEFHLSSRSLQTSKKTFDHLRDETINLVFVPRTSVHITEGRWYDPDEQEFRIIRHVYDRSEETKKAIERPKGGATRVHSIPTKELYDHKPGLWKVVLYIDNQLAGTQTFFVKNKDEPPPLPPIEETKPPLTMKSDYFKYFPWSALAKPRKDGSDPDTTTYTIEQGDTLDRVAEKMMGNPALASALASYNDISPSSKVPVGDKIVIPNPIIGMSSQIMLKSNGDNEFGAPQSFDTKFKMGDEYKFRFEPNVDGYCYIFREGPKGVELLYPAALKMQPRAQTKSGQKAEAQAAPAPVMPDTGKVKAHQPIEIPIGKKGFLSDGKVAGDQVFVFLSLRPIPDLESLKEKAKIKVEDVEDVTHRVKQGEIYSEGQYRLLRINAPAEIMGFALNLNG